MKPFQTYIFELSKAYEFRIKLAGSKPTPEVMESIKAALESFQLESISAVKHLPIQEHREFPQWGGACEVWQFDVKVAYPATDVGIRQLIKERARLNPNWINVRSLNEANYTDEAEALGQGRTGALLDEAELESNTEGQSMVGPGRVASLIAELEKHSRKYEFAENSNEKGETLNTAPMGTTSPMSKQNKVYRGTQGMKTK